MYSSFRVFRSSNIFFFLFILHPSPFTLEARHTAKPSMDQTIRLPNILLVLSDDHSVPHLGSYGDPNCLKNNLTPNLDKFAKQGMRFTRSYTASPQCAPSRTSIFAGRSPIGIRATRFAQPAASNTVFFTDILRKNGYWVGLDGRHQHLDGKNRDAEHIQETLLELGMRGIDFESRFDHFVGSFNTKNQGLAKVPDMLNAALDKVPDDKPFFLYFGFNQPHRKFGGDHENIDPASLILPDDWPDLPGVRLDYARFLNEVRDLDTGFGSLMNVLDERGIADNTLVIFMGDNGEALLRGKGTVLGRGTHVPLLVRWPAMTKSGAIEHSLISGVDLAPTILDAAGLKPSKDMTGTSFLSALKGKKHKERQYVYAERGWHYGPITRSDGLDLSRSVTSKDFHFIYNALPDRSYSPVDMSNGKNVAWEDIQTARQNGKLSADHERIYFQDPRPIFELYDIDKDPFQLNNLAGTPEYKAVEEKLRNELDVWMIREGDYLPLPAHVKKTTK